jgi:hypothetical protein
MAILNALKGAGKTVGQVVAGFGKGTLDTVASVPRNIKKFGGAYFDAKIMPHFTKSIDNLNDSNKQMLDAIKKLDKADPQYTAKKDRLSNAVKQNLSLQGEIQKEADQAKDDYDAGKVNLFKKDMTINTTALDKYTTTTNKAQRIGFTGEKIAELIAPAGAVDKADKALKGTQMVNATKAGQGAAKVLGKALQPAVAAKIGNAVTKTAKTVNAANRIGSRAALEAGSTGLASLGQSAYQGRLDTQAGAKGAFKEAGTAAATAGVLKGVMVGAGEAARAMQLPQKLYSRTYKTTDKEMQKLFDNLGDSASTKVAGADETLADWALNKGIVGATKKQAATVMQMLDDSEKAVIDTARKSGVNIVVDPGAIRTAQSVAEEYADYGKGEVAKKADDFLKSIADDGTASVEDAIKFRRTLDGLRSKASFRNAKVGDNISYWADELRGQINGIPALGQINKDYAMAMKARDALITKAVSENNKMILGALEAYTAAMPLMNRTAAEGGASNLAGAAIVAAKRFANNTGVQTKIAQGLNTLGDVTKKGYGMRQIFGKAVASPETFGRGKDLGFSADTPADTDAELDFMPDTQNAAAPAPVYKIRTDYEPTADDADLGFTAIEN